MKYCHIPKSFVFIFFITFTCQLQSVVHAQQVWKKDFHMPNAYIKGFDAYESYDYGYMIVGTLENLVTDQTYGWIIKADINGEKLWHRCIGQDGGSQLDCMAKTNDGGAIVGGNYGGYNQNGDAFLMKFNACAESEWCVILPDKEEDGSIVVAGIVQLVDGSFICDRRRISMDHYSNQSLIKLSPDGEVQWINYYDTNHDFNSQIDNDLILTNDNCVMIAGIVYDTIYPGYPYVSAFPHFYKVDSDGNLLWERKWYIDPFQIYGEPYDAFEGWNGNYYCGGAKLQLQQPFIYKISTVGDTINSYRIIDDPLSIGGIVSSVSSLDDTTLIISTGCWRDLESDWRWSLNLDDTLLNKRSGICEEELIWDIQTFVTHDQKIVMKSNSYEGYPSYPFNVLLYKFNSSLEYDSIYSIPRIYDSLCPHPIVSDTIFLPNACRLYTSLPHLQDDSKFLKMNLFPNPANQYLNVQTPEYSVDSKNTGSVFQQHYEPLSGMLELNLIDLDGHVVFEKTFDAQEKNQLINVQTLSNGVYLAIILQNGQKIASAKFIISNK